MKATVKIRDTGVTVAQVLKLISEGYSYDKILNIHPAVTMGDIMAAADLARQVIEQLEDERGEIESSRGGSLIIARGQVVDLDKLRQRHPRAYRPWTPREDNQLAEMFKRGLALNQMSEQLGRQPGAIRIRLDKLEVKR